MAASKIDLIQRLVEKGSDPLVFQVCRRVDADRTTGPDSLEADLLTWPEIAAWAYGLELLDHAEVTLLSSRGLDGVRILPGRCAM